MATMVPLRLPLIIVVAWCFDFIVMYGKGINGHGWLSMCGGQTSTVLSRLHISPMNLCTSSRFILNTPVFTVICCLVHVVNRPCKQKPGGFLWKGGCCLAQSQLQTFPEEFTVDRGNSCFMNLPLVDVTSNQMIGWLLTSLLDLLVVHHSRFHRNCKCVNVDGTDQIQPPRGHCWWFLLGINNNRNSSSSSSSGGSSKSNNNNNSCCGLRNVNNNQCHYRHLTTSAGLYLINDNGRHANQLEWAGHCRIMAPN